MENPYSQAPARRAWEFLPEEIQDLLAAPPPATHPVNPDKNGGKLLSNSLAPLVLEDDFALRIEQWNRAVNLSESGNGLATIQGEVQTARDTRDRLREAVQDIAHEISRIQREGVTVKPERTEDALTELKKMRGKLKAHFLLYQLRRHVFALALSEYRQKGSISPLSLSGVHQERAIKVGIALQTTGKTAGDFAGLTDFKEWCGRHVYFSASAVYESLKEVGCWRSDRRQGDSSGLPQIIRQVKDYASKHKQLLRLLG